MIWVVLLAAVIPLCHYFFSGVLKEKHTKVKAAFLQIEEQFKRRNNLIPDFVPLIKAPLESKSQLIAELLRLRTKAVSPVLNDDEKIAMAVRIAELINELVADAQKLPEIAEKPKFQMLLSIHKDIDEKLQPLGHSYNECVKLYNQAVVAFPTSLFAALLNLQERKDFPGSSV